MATTINQRFKTGERCRETGSYEFDGFTDGSSSPHPSPDESEIMMSTGDTFPTVRSAKKECYWKPSEMTQDDDLAEAATSPDDDE